MPRFPSAFNRRKSTADNLDNAVAGPSFRVLDRAEVASDHRRSMSNGNNSSHFSIKSQSVPNALAVDINNDDDNLFRNQGINRYDLPGNKKRTSNKWFKQQQRADANLHMDSGSANTNTSSTDNSSRHSNVSTAPSSADLNIQQKQQKMEDDSWAAQNKQQFSDVPLPPIPKSSTSSFLKSAGRTLSFGNRKQFNNSTDEGKKVPQTPPTAGGGTGRDRSMTASTVDTSATATPPKIEEEFDLGGDFGKMLNNFDNNKRASVATLRLGQQTSGERSDERHGETDRPALMPRSLTGNRLNQPSPIMLDNTSKIDPSPNSYNSQVSHHSTEKLLYSNTGSAANENAPPVVPRHASPYGLGGDYAPSPPPAAAAPPRPTDNSGLRRSSAVFRRRSTVDFVAEAEDEDTVLLKDSLFSVNRFLSGTSLTNAKTATTPPASTMSRFGRRNDDSGKPDSGYSKVPTEVMSPTYGAVPVADEEDDNMFDTKPMHSARAAPRAVAHKPTATQNKVMTPAQFERYRKYKESESVSKVAGTADADDKATDDKSDSEDDNYDDDVDEAEKSKQAAKQRRKQEAHMAVYRQQMMKVTGETAPVGPMPHSNMSYSMSTPNLSSLTSADAGNAGNEDEDEEVPLAILAAHGFPSRSRAPTRLNNMMSNPNLRAAAAPSFQRPQSATIGADGQPAPQLTASASNGRLPAFARNLPQDPYGLINQNQREPLNFAGGAPAAGGALPPGGLVGVIASEERSRAMRRGSPALDAANKPLPNMSGNNAMYDPMAAMPSHMMYPGVGAGMGGQMPVLTPGDQAQIQMTQQMQQFMQMQMQFMQMMAGGQRPMSQMGGSVQGNPMGPPMGMGMGGDGSVRQSYMDSASVMDVQLPQLDLHSRSMSMVHPSNASWMQPPPPVMGSGYAPSIRIQGANSGYQASIAPSERSNVGLPGRYRPVSNAPAAVVGGASPSLDPTPGPTSGPHSPGWDLSRKHKSPSPLQKEATAAVAPVEEEDDEEGWAAMKAKRDKKRSLWKAKKTLPSEVGALIS